MKQSLSSLSVKTTTALNHLELLRCIMPPQAIIHIGAGTGNGDMHLWRQWQVPCALIIDADPTRLSWAESLTAENPAWQVHSAVLADSNNEADYYSATNPDQDGLIAPEKLVALWPNLRTSEQIRCQTQRLDSLLHDQALTDLQQDSSTWTLIDCLPALPILQGAGSELDRWSVLWLRVLLKPLTDDDAVGTLQALETFLQPHGYRCIHVNEGNHPAIGEALFVRNWHDVLMPDIKQLSKENAALAAEKSTLAQQASAVNSELQNQIATLSQARDQQSQLATEHQAQIATLTQERDSHAQQAQERQTQLEALTQANATLTQEKTTLVEQRSALDKEIATLSQARDQQSQLATERQAQIATLTQERDSHAQQAQERQTQLEALTQANATLTQEKTTLAEQRSALDKDVATLSQARDEQAKLATQCKNELDQLQSKLQQKESHIAKLEAEFAESDARQRMLNEEMIKAEAQIDLIKDVLLREPGL